MKLKWLPGLAKHLWRRVANPMRSVRDIPTPLSDQLRHGEHALANRLVAEALTLGVQYVVNADVGGSVAEFGCMTGRTARVLAAAMATFYSRGELHLFDSFEGLPAATATEDLTAPHVVGDVWGEGDCRGISPDALRVQCSKFVESKRIRIFRGWFCDTLHHIPAGTAYGLVHIDSDLYLSAFEVLDYLFARRMLCEGAMVLFDDWECNRASNKHGERAAWLAASQKHQACFSDCGNYGWSGKKFIVHFYASSRCASNPEEKR